MSILTTPPVGSPTASVPPEAAFAERDRKKKLAQDILKRHDTLKSRRLLWERLWQEVRELVRPNAEDFTRRTPRAQNRKERVFDDFPSFALQNMAAGIHSKLTNPAERWAALSSGDSDVDEQEQVADHLEFAANRIFDEFADPDTGFNTSSHEFYQDCGGFGTGVLNLMEDDLHLRIRSIPLAQCYISENDFGIVDTVHREFPFTIRQAVLAFGKENLPEKLLKEEESEREEKFLHAVYPVGVGALVPFKSVYIHLETQEIVSEGLFHDFPYCVVRWTKMSGDVYGRAPGTDCLQDIRVLNEAKRLMLQSSQLQAAPPIIFENDGVLAKVVLQPWGQLPILPGSAMPKALELGGNLNVGQDLVNDLHDTIGKNFFNDLFENPSYGKRDRVTAQEVSTDSSTRIERLSPILGRFEVEFLNPLIQRMYRFLRRTGQIPEPPKALKGKKLKIIYLSPAAQALRAQKAGNNLRFVQQLMPLTQFKPDILDPFDMDEIVKQMGFAYDISRTAVISADKVANIRAQRAQQQAAAAQPSQAVDATNALKNVALARQAAPDMGNLMPQQQLPSP